MSRIYETAEICFEGAAPAGSEALAAPQAVFVKDGKELSVKGFYAGDGLYKVRFLPEETGTWQYTITGDGTQRPLTGTLEVEPQEAGAQADGEAQTAGAKQGPQGSALHGPVRACGTHLKHADGTWFYSFGTTVYALAHQSEALMNETFETLAQAPFNKVRLCVFPKHYNYNHNNPRYYAFERSAAGEGLTFEAQEGDQVAGMSDAKDTSVNNWDVNRPCYAFWDAFEDKLLRLQDLGIEADLILFHPYDRWGFANMPQQDNLIYLDYLLRRLAAFPNVWWSLANEYDLCMAKSLQDWEEIEQFVAEHDPYHHMLSNHNCFKPWDWSRQNVTHVSWQTRELYRVQALLKEYGKPVLIDECRYEGNVPESWGNISGKSMAQRFWQVTVCGGYCTHGETFYPGTKEAELNTQTGESEVVWWARGGRLHGESPARIAFLKEIVDSLPGPIEPAAGGLQAILLMSPAEQEKVLEQTPEGFRDFLKALLAMSPAEQERFLAFNTAYEGKVGDGDAFLVYKDTECSSLADLTLPTDKTYRIEVIDTWEMTRETVQTGASGKVQVRLPGREYMAVLAVKE